MGHRSPGGVLGTSRLEYPRYGRYVALLAILILVLITVNTVLTKPNGATGIQPGHAVPPFAVPLAQATLEGAADVALRPGEGAKHAACALRGPQILNICQLYERRAVVLALFVQAGSCARILGDMQALAPSFPGVSFAAVSIKGERASLRRLVRARRLSIPVGYDGEGALAPLYKLATCPQVTFIYPGGIVQSQALLGRPPIGTLRARVRELLAATALRRSGAGAGR
jgi:hypothetical protein